MLARLKTPKFLTLAVIVVLISLLLSAFRNANHHPNPFQIKKVPSRIEQAPLLEVNTHIRITPRPQETFGFPIEVGNTGPVQSLYAGPLQYPFYCMTWESNLGQPLVDNQDGIGVPVFRMGRNDSLTDDVVGYSKDCMINTRIDYFYIDNDGLHHPYTDETDPSHIQMLTIDKQQVPFIIRVERGTIDRFIYVIAMLVGDASGHTLENTRYWNHKLIFQFGGGSGIGFRQGKMQLKKVVDRRIEQLKQGYAVIGSTGNITSYTYNMLLMEDNAVRVKEQFVARYGEPEYTIGIGGSGGAIQSYLLAQNRPGLLDGIIPQYAYPDMVSQTIYALDCDLLGHYFAIKDADNPHWADWQYRRPVIGLNSLNGFEQKHPWLAMLNQAYAGVMPQKPTGSNECINGWFGLSSLVNNPRMSYLKSYYSDTLLHKLHWSYWQDMVNVYGKDKQGFARTTWDNEGVQYGLRGFVEGRISQSEFLKLNREIGAWKPQQKQQTEHFFYALSNKFPVWTTMWSRHNITSADKGPAPRLKASLKAIELAYRYGQVFIGKLDVPVIDIRHYLEPQLNMHHVSASFSSRLRMQRQGLGEQQLIWISDPAYDYTTKAFSVIDRWLDNIKAHPQRTVSQNKPQDATDECADAGGKVLAKGPDVWDGRWNNKADGSCTQIYPYYSNSRIQAGDDWSTTTFKCTLQPVSTAMAKGIYGDKASPELLKALEQIFPTGVCDYSQPDQGRPTDL